MIATENTEVTEYSLLTLLTLLTSLTYFHSGKLRTLLIFCAAEPNRFSEADLGLYEVYYPAFLKALRDWRKGKRKKVLNK